MTVSVPDLVTVAASTAVVEWGRVRFADIAGFHREARARIDAALARQGVSTTGAPLTFSRAPAGGFIEIAPGSTVASAFQPEGTLTVQEIPAGRAAHLRLDGPYDQLSQAWGQLAAWVSEQGLVSGRLNWEVYSDPTGPVTDLYALLNTGQAYAVDQPLRSHPLRPHGLAHGARLHPSS